MADFYVKVPSDKIDFFKELMIDLGYEHEHIQTTNNPMDLNDDEEFFTDADD